jgi:hypothetical protein
MPGLIAQVITQEFGNDPLLEGRPAAVELPVGFYRVWCGAVKPGDMYLDWDVWCRSRGRSSYWAVIGDLRSDAGAYECLIRRGTPVNEACARCGCVDVAFNHHCSFCCDIILDQVRRKAT